MTTFALTPAELARVERIDRLVAIGPSGLDELILGLSDPSWPVRRAVVAALAALGDEAVAPLCEWLATMRTTERAIAAAVDALATSRGTTATAGALALLGHATPAVACDGAHILGRRRASDAVAALAAAVAHEDDNVAVAAIEALGAIADAAALDSLLRVVEARNFFRTFAALQVISNVRDPRVVAPVAELLADELYRAEAIRALGRTGHPLALEPLASTLGSDDASVRLVALALADLLAKAEWTGALEHVAGRMRDRLTPALPRFVAALRDADAAERAALATVIGRIGNAIVLPALAGLLDDPEAGVAARSALQQLARHSDSTLLAALRSSDRAVQRAVLEVAHSAASAGPIRALLGDDDAEIRALAAAALGRLGDTAAVPALFARLSDANPRVGYAVVGAIHSLGASVTAQLASEALAGPSAVARRHALRIVGYLGIETAFAQVVVATRDSDLRTAELAVATLAGFGDPTIANLLDELSRDARDPIRAAAMRAAARRGDDAILEGGLGDPAPWVRYYACQGLGQRERTDATAQLVERLEDPADHVRLAAIEALGHLRSRLASEALVAAARSERDDMRRAALASLGLDGHPESLPILLDGVASSDLATRLVAIQGLARRSEPEAIAALATAAADPEPQLAAAALSLFADRSDRPAADALVELALQSPPTHPVHATLSRPAPERIAAIASRLDGAESDVVADVLVAALARMRDGHATAVLADALDSSNARARRAAAGTLGAIGSHAARLAALATSDPDPDVRRVCAAASER